MDEDHPESALTAPDAGLHDLFRRERAGMLRVAVLLVGSRAEAEEAVQEAFAGVIARWDSIREPGAYLRTSVVNACKMVVRRRDMERRRQIERQHHSLDGAHRLDVPGDLAELAAAMAVLSRRERTAVVLRYVADQSDDEIAATLNCRPATVRSLIHRALSKLRKELS